MLRCQLFSTHYIAAQIYNCLKTISATKVVIMKITDDFRYMWKPSRAYHKINTFSGDKDEWYTKEGTGKFMKNTLCAQRYSKRHLLGWSDIEQQKKSSPKP